MTVAADRVALRPARPVVYPTSDGKPMGETDRHRDLTIYLIDALKVYFAGRPEVYVSGDNFLYWEEGNPRKCVSPDCYVVFDAGMRQRDCYKAWEEGNRLPDVVFEITSRKTRREDAVTKHHLYEQVLRVPEYFVFDPTGDYLRPRLLGHRLVEGRYLLQEPVDGRLFSEALRLELVQEGENLFLDDPERGERLPTSLEQARRVEAAARQVEAAERRAAAAEAESDRLRAELDALRKRGG